MSKVIDKLIADLGVPARVFRGDTERAASHDPADGAREPQL